MGKVEQPEANGVQILSISQNLEKYCIQITKYDKPIKDIENKLKDVEKVLSERVAELEKSNADASNPVDRSLLEQEIIRLVKQKIELMQQKTELQQQRAGFLREIKYASGSSNVSHLIEGTTSGAAQITDYDEQLKNIQAQLDELQKSIDESICVSVSTKKESSANAVDDNAPAEYIRRFAEQKADLMFKKAELEEKRGELKKQTRQENSRITRLVGGKTSGVTGGAVVEIEKNGERKQYMLKNIFHTEKTYKNIFGQEKRHSGKHFYDPNCKSEERAFFTRHTLKEVNDSVLQEFIALRLANVVSPGIAPDAILGKIADDGNSSQGPVRYCLLTEMAGQREGENFSTLDDIEKKNRSKNNAASNDLVKDGSIELNDSDGYGIDKDVWKSFYAIGIGLLNDKDVAKKDNIGVVTKGGSQDANLSLFDLGHASPDEFKLDKETLLPKSKSKMADGVLFLINCVTTANSIPGTFYFDEDIEKILSVDERKEAILELLAYEDDILGELGKIKEEIADNDVSGDNQKVVEDMKRRIQARFNQLRDVLAEHSKIEEKEAKKFAKDYFVKKDITILDIPEDDIKIEEIPD